MDITYLLWLQDFRISINDALTPFMEEISFFSTHYIILSGTGTFTDGEGNEYIVGPQSVTIAVAGESHSLTNTGKDNLVFIDLIAQNHALKKGE